MKANYTKEILTEIVKSSYHTRDVLEKLGLAPKGGNYKTLKSKLMLYEIDTNHFKGRGWNTGERFRDFSVKRSLESILVENSTYTNTSNLKSRLIRVGIKEYKCENCKLEVWQDCPIPLELHHINGKNLDNRIENITLLCPNCHAMTDNYRGKNIKPV